MLKSVVTAALLTSTSWSIRSLNLALIPEFTPQSTSTLIVMTSTPSIQNRVVLLQKVEGMQNLRAELQIRLIPEVTPGSVVIRVLAATVRAKSPRIYRDPKSGYPLPFPLVPGHTAIGRVSKIPSDVTILKEGQLVFFDPYIQARDGGGFYISAMMEGFTPESFKLSRGDWRDGIYADYAKLPIENCHVLDESRLLGHESQSGLGYTLLDLTHLFSMLVPFGDYQISISSQEIPYSSPQRLVDTGQLRYTSPQHWVHGLWLLAATTTISQSLPQ